MTMGWDDIKAPETGGKDFDKLDFMKLEVGKPVKVRVLTEAPIQKLQYYITGVRGVAYGGSKGIYVPVTPLTKAWVARHNDNEQDKEKRVRENRQFSLLVWDYADNKVKVLQKGWSLFGVLKGFATNPEYGDLRGYDITITNEDKTGTKYTVAPARSNTPLNDDQQEFVDNMPSLEEIRDNITNSFDSVKEEVWMEALMGRMTIKEAFEKHYPKDGESAPKEEKKEPSNEVKEDDTTLTADDLKGYDL